MFGRLGRDFGRLGALPHVPVVEEESEGPAVGDGLLLEDGDFLLLENGDFLLLE